MNQTVASPFVALFVRGLRALGLAELGRLEDRLEKSRSPLAPAKRAAVVAEMARRWRLAASRI